MNETIRQFITSFETTFKDFLLPAQRQKEEDIITGFFRVTNDKSKEKYSDWDIEVEFAPHALNPEVIKNVDHFIRSFQDFHCTGCFLSLSPDYKHVSQHIDNIHRINYLQYMAFMVGEDNAPFVDCHILNVESLNVKSAFSEKDDYEIKMWSIITAWRKLKNKDIAGFEHIVNIYVLPAYPSEETEIKNYPDQFFSKKLSNTKFAAVADYLRS